MERARELDSPFLLAALALGAIGLLALTSGGAAQSPLAARQAAWLGLGVAVLAVVLAVDYRTWLELAPAIYALNAAALLWVLLFGHRVNGSRSWIALGHFNLQPSEFMKIATVLVAARLLAAERGERASLGTALRLALVGGLPLALISAQPDMGTAITFAAILAALVFAVGLAPRVWALLGLAFAGGALLAWLHVLKEYQKERIRTFLFPETDPLASGYQIIQSRIAIGSGGLAGKGYAAGTQSQLNFIPEKHTDFVFPVVAEEWGFVGTLVVLGLYVFLLSRGLETAVQARDARGAYLVLGIMALVAAHALINLGMVMGLLPTIGIPLPLMSYGGSSVVSTLAGIGLCLNVRMRRIANA